MTSSYLSGYARCSTDRQDLTAQREALLELGVPAERIYLDEGLTGTNRARPGSTKLSPPSDPETPSWCPNSTGSTAPCPTPATSATPWSPAA